MKKIAIIFCQILLLLVACEPVEDNFGTRQMDFSIEVTSVLQKTISIKITPSDNENTYYYGIMPLTEYIDDASLKLEDMLRFEEMAERNSQTVEEILLSELHSGEITETFDNLFPGVVYCIYVYQIDENGLAEYPVAKKEITTTGYENVQIGDFFLVDGTIASKDGDITEEIRNKIAGVVFWLGDPTSEGHDATLRKEHSNCTNGLVMALDTIKCNWSNNSGKFINPWVKRDGRYMEILFGDGEGVEQPYNFIRGYNNTKALEAYNIEASEYDRVNVIEEIRHYSDSIKLPYSTSGWYLPSLKELSLMIIGNYDGDIWEIAAYDAPEPVVYNEVNTSIGKVGGDCIPEMQFAWSSTEHSAAYAMKVFYNGVLSAQYKYLDYQVYARPVFAF